MTTKVKLKTYVILSLFQFVTEILIKKTHQIEKSSRRQFAVDQILWLAIINKISNHLLETK